MGTFPARQVWPLDPPLATQDPDARWLHQRGFPGPGILIPEDSLAAILQQLDDDCTREQYQHANLPSPHSPVRTPVKRAGQATATSWIRPAIVIGGVGFFLWFAASSQQQHLKLPASERYARRLNPRRGRRRYRRAA